ncbi:hypothetical protein RHSIM_Rhsim05G0080800 [Rhododendron simsii]|uniref:RRM domain-containing protein n=1 Tax=Rhododendron simsii TaxID=118357 RepID=A0A834H119_RHOSS|nr:hypothetical protein RHSIM_Rhsim05G0080800 [Rhododendron simsii]
MDPDQIHLGGRDHSNSESSHDRHGATPLISPLQMGSVGEAASNIVVADSTSVSSHHGVKRGRLASWVWDHFHKVEHFIDRNGIDQGLKAVVEVVRGDCVIVAVCIPYGSPLAEQRVTISSVMCPKVMLDSQGASKGSGFVAFSALEEATRAVIQAQGGMTPLPAGMPVFHPGTPRLALQQFYYGQGAPGLLPPQPAG